MFLSPFQKVRCIRRTHGTIRPLLPFYLSPALPHGAHMTQVDSPILKHDTLKVQEHSRRKLLFDSPTQHDDAPQRAPVASNGSPLEIHCRIVRNMLRRAMQDINWLSYTEVQKCFMWPRVDRRGMRACACFFFLFFRHSLAPYRFRSL
jgi:hypothetical protein